VYLTDWGMTVGAADTGPAALATLRIAAGQGRPFAVALPDRSSPGMDGLALRNAIVVDPALGTRLVLMTGLGQECDPGAAGESREYAS
jgi:two-component system, sensor histidine kinase and response regulator